MSNPSSPPPDRGPSFSGTKRRWPRPFVVYIYNPNPNNNIWKLNEDDYENMIKAAWTGKYFDDILNTWVDGLPSRAGVPPLPLLLFNPSVGYNGGKPHIFLLFLSLFIFFFN